MYSTEAVQTPGAKAKTIGISPQWEIIMSVMSVSITPPGSLSKVVQAYINQFQQRVQSYSDQEIVLSDKFELQKTVEILQGPFDKKTVFRQINSFHLQKGSIII